MATEQIYEVPLTPAPQKFDVKLGGATYGFQVQYRDPSPGWVLDVFDANGVLLVACIPLVTGVDLLWPFAYLGFGGQLRVQTDGDPDAVPTFENLGVKSHLYFVAVTL
jgi:hypothetical protein